MTTDAAENSTMTALQTIVVPIDGSITSERALHPAHEMATATGAGVRLMTVLPIELWTGRVDEATQHLEKLAADEKLEEPEIVVVTDQAVAEAIVAAAAEPDSIVCMSTHGHVGWTEALLGSIAEAVMRESETPILLVGPHCASGWAGLPGGNMVVAVDGSDASEEIVAPAIEFARKLALRVYLVQVVAPDTGADAATDARYLHQLGAALLPTSPEAQWEVLHGSSPGESVVEFARRLPATLVAAATHGRTGLARAVAGSVVTHILHDSPCPVLTLRPRTLR